MLKLTSELLQQTLDIAYLAGEHLTYFYQKTASSAVQISQKSDNTPVTEVDLFLSQFLIEKLTALTPSIPVLSEENCNIPLAEREQWHQYWLIDPLDGTQQFINRTGYFSVLITLMQNNQAVLGIIHAPVLQTTYYAMQHYGAYKKVAQNVQRLLPRTLDLSRPIKVAVGASGAKKKARQTFNDNYQYEFVICGSSGIKSGLVADGSCDCYLRLGKTSEWDTAPAEIILQEMGGAVFDDVYQPLIYNQKNDFGNPNFLMVSNKNSNWQKLFRFNINSLT